MLLEALDKRTDRSRTSVLLTSDHGDLLGDAGIFYKSCFLEGAVRVPCVYLPAPAVGLEGGLQSRQPAGINYLLGRVLDALGEETPSSMDEWVDGIPEVCSEFRKELLVVRGHRKLVLGRKGKPENGPQTWIMTQLRAGERDHRQPGGLEQGSPLEGTAGRSRKDVPVKTVEGLDPSRPFP